MAAPLWFVVDGTVVCYEELVCFLAPRHQSLSVLLPNKAKYFAQSIEMKSKTDLLYTPSGLGTRPCPLGGYTTPALRRLRALARERQSLTQQSICPQSPVACLPAQSRTGSPHHRL